MRSFNHLYEKVITACQKFRSTLDNIIFQILLDGKVESSHLNKYRVEKKYATASVNYQNKTFFLETFG